MLSVFYHIRTEFREDPSRPRRASECAFAMDLRYGCQKSKPGQAAGKNILVLGEKYKLKGEFVLQMSQGSSRDCSSSRRVLDLMDGKKSLPIRIDLESQNDNCISHITIELMFNLDIIHLFISASMPASACIRSWRSKNKLKEFEVMGAPQ
jgi:hypothetical protein